MSEVSGAPEGANVAAPAPDTSPALPHTLAHVRDRAKALLKAARRGDAGVIAQLRTLLPRLTDTSDEAVAHSIKLADVQHALARRLGFDNWAVLKSALEARQPIHARAAQFLAHFRDEQIDRAAQLLAESPELGAYSIHTSAAVGDLAALNRWLSVDAALANTPSMPDDTLPMIYAVQTTLKRRLGVTSEQHVALVRALLDAGADVNASKALPDQPGRISALYFPSDANNVPLATLLLERGANPNDGESVYHAAQHNHRDILEVLFAHGADISGLHPEYGNTPLYFLATHRASNPIASSVILGMQWLLEHGANPNVASNIMPSGKPTPSAHETPLQRAAASGFDESVMRLLVSHGANVNATRADGKSAYVLAVRSGNTSAAEYLASVGADVNTLTDVDRLLGACALHDATAAHSLVRADSTLLTRLTAEDRAFLGHYVGDGQRDVVALMISLGWPLADEGEWGGTPLHWAAWNGRAELVRLLVDAGAPINMRDTTYGSSPIAWAAHGSTFCDRRPDSDYLAVVTALLNAGATRVESFNKWGESPEGMAAPEVATLLRARGFALD